MGNGGFFSVMPTVVAQVFGSVRVSIAMGAIVTRSGNTLLHCLCTSMLTLYSWTGGYLMGAPIAGYLLDAFGGEDAGL